MARDRLQQHPGRVEGEAERAFFTLMETRSAIYWFTGAPGRIRTCGLRIRRQKPRAWQILEKW